MYVPYPFSTFIDNLSVYLYTQFWTANLDQDYVMVTLQDSSAPKALHKGFGVDGGVGGSGPPTPPSTPKQDEPPQAARGPEELHVMYIMNSM